LFVENVCCWSVVCFVVVVVVLGFGRLYVFVVVACTVVVCVRCLFLWFLLFLLSNVFVSRFVVVIVEVVVL